MIEWDAGLIRAKQMGNKLEILKSYQDRPVPNLGERMLWVAVFMQVIEDLNPRTAAFGNSQTSRKRIKQSATHWIKSPNNSFNSFIGICEMVGMCPNKVRRKLLNGGRC